MSFVFRTRFSALNFSSSQSWVLSHQNISLEINFYGLSYLALTIVDVHEHHVQCLMFIRITLIHSLRRHPLQVSISSVAADCLNIFTQKYPALFYLFVSEKIRSEAHHSQKDEALPPVISRLLRVCPMDSEGGREGFRGGFFHTGAWSGNWLTPPLFILVGWSFLGFDRQLCRLYKVSMWPVRERKILLFFLFSCC